MTPTHWKPTSDDYLDALLGQNPWQKSGKFPKAFEYPQRRPLANQLWQTIIQDPWRYQLIIGPRRVGKTVTLYQTIESLMDEGIPHQRLWFMRMDHPLFLHYPLGGWVRSLVKREKPTADRPLYLFLDEINYSKDWDTWLKTFYDEKWPVQVVATSSSSAALHNESGIGRWALQYLTPYSFGEYLRLIGQRNPVSDCIKSDSLLNNLLQSCNVGQQSIDFKRMSELYALIGGFPELLLDRFDPDDPETSILRSQQILRSEAIQRVAGMDLPQVFHIRQPLALERLLYLLAGQMGNIISTRSLGNALDLNHQTVAEYIGYLEKAYLIFTLPSYSNSEVSIQRRGRKVYFIDGAVRNAALQRGLRPTNNPEEYGALIENLVGSHLFALSLQNDIRLFHWRERKQEVDFIYDDPSGPVAIEVTASRNHHLKGLKALLEKYPRFKGRCFLVSQSDICHPPEQDPQGIGRIPLEDFLMTTSATIERSLARRSIPLHDKMASKELLSLCGHNVSDSFVLCVERMATQPGLCESQDAQ